MGVTRLAFETSKAYWRKVHKSDGDIQHFRIAKSGEDAGLARAKQQQSFAAAKTHVDDTDSEKGHTVHQFQNDDTDRFTYDDAVQVGHLFTPPISFDSVKGEDPFTEFQSLGEVYDFLAGKYKDMHGVRDGYQGIYWHMTYSIVLDDGTINHHEWNSGMWDSREPLFYWEGHNSSDSGTLKELWKNLQDAYDSYSDVIIESVSVNYRNGPRLEL